MLKIGQNWVKFKIIPPNAQQRFAPLAVKAKQYSTKISKIWLIRRDIRYCTA